MSNWQKPMQAEQTLARWTPTTASDKQAVWEQVERILRDPAFSKSRRYPSFIRHIIEQSLNGEEDSLKERLLGIELFNRSPDYDSTIDPIVRVTAAEVRKRLGRYYLDPKHSNELHITIRSGSYIPSYEVVAEDSIPDNHQLNFAPNAEQITESTINLSSLVTDTTSIPEISIEKSTRRYRNLALVIVCIVIITCAATVVLYKDSTGQSTFESLWSPFFRATSPVILCIADQPVHAELLDANNPELIPSSSDLAAITFSSNVQQATRIAATLSAHSRSFRLQTQSTTKFSDFGNGPAILVGAYNNYWSLKFTSSLRFHFANDPTRSFLWIEDRQAPSAQNWKLDAKKPIGFGKDYAIIARFVPQSTGQPTLVVAGLGHAATVEGVQLALSPQRLNELGGQLPRGWTRRNVEIVIETEVLNGLPGPSRIVAADSW